MGLAMSWNMEGVGGVLFCCQIAITTPVGEKGGLLSRQFSQQRSGPEGLAREPENLGSGPSWSLTE